MAGIRIHILRCGSIEPAREAVFGGGSGPGAALRHAAAAAAGRIELPCMCYLIEHPKGLVLVDTGVGRVFSPSGSFDAAASRALIGAPMTAYLRPSVAEGQSISERLSAMGLSPADIDILLLSHLDADHIGGLHELRGVKRILLPEDEYYWSCRMVYKLRQPAALWSDMPIERFWYRGSPLGSNRWASDLFADESVMLINLPGHTDGLCATLIRNGGRFVLLASDAALCRENIDSLTPPGFCFDKGMGRRSLEYIRSLRAESGCEAVLISHDREERRDTLLL